ncbi:hypothetical protein [Chryseobacterium rhizosphaerae]|uniref:hypothetical protein n=1 Tax=Chryseobacterium rhizosphaerae TaxID=395937 RepID=UPI00235A3FE6|nr:hypothetical protein [Chryseobacterium rhizosphaerae]MDC8102444.1 hypothetical protein [Chryseobacterium rhizosphaerae]
MEKNVLLLTALSFSTLSFAQVGINRVSPHLSSDLELGSTNKTLILNRVSNTGTVPNPVNGMMIYDLSEECVKAYQAGKWSKCLGKGLNSKKSQSPVNATALTPTSVTVSPRPITGKAYKGTPTISYSGGNGDAYETQTIQTNKLTAVLPAGEFVAKNGRL